MKLLVTLLLAGGLATAGISAYAGGNAPAASLVAPASDTLDVRDVEVAPQFPGGQDAMMNYIATHVMYPAQAAEDGAQGKVVVRFVIGKDGSVSNVEVLRSKHPALDREAVRVIKSMPKWTPGKMNGRAVNVYFNCPVTFRLQ